MDINDTNVRNLLLHNILPRVPVRDMPSVALTCKVFARLVRHDLLWVTLWQLQYATMEGVVVPETFTADAKWLVMANTPVAGWKAIPVEGAGVAKINLGGSIMYRGEYANSEISGRGHLQGMHGLEEGYFVKRKLHGYGRRRTAFRDGKELVHETRRGTFVDGQQTDGMWRYGEIQFDGQFADGEPCLGQLTFKDAHYIGQVAKYRENGKGAFYIHRAGDRIECDEWKRGALNGAAKYCWGNGNVMITRYRNGKVLDGIVKYTDTHGWGFEETFVDGTPVTGAAVHPPLLRDCTARNHCTFSVTKRERHGQVYWRKMVNAYVPSMVGYCVVCARTCYPTHKPLHGAVEFQWAFSGNFYCLCGAGELSMDMDCLVHHGSGPGSLTNSAETIPQ